MLKQLILNWGTIEGDSNYYLKKKRIEKVEARGSTVPHHPHTFYFFVSPIGQTHETIKVIRL